MSQKSHILLKLKYICHLIVLTSQKSSKQDVYYEKNITQNIDKPVSNIKQNMDKPVSNIKQNKDKPVSNVSLILMKF